MVPNNYTLGVSISSSQEVVTPLRKTCYKKKKKKKRLRKTRVKKCVVVVFVRVGYFQALLAFQPTPPQYDFLLFSIFWMCCFMEMNE